MDVSKNIVLIAARKALDAENRALTKQRDIIVETVEKMKDMDSHTVNQTFDEAMKSFKAEDRKGSRASEYQYVSRLRQIVGAFRYTVWTEENGQIVYHPVGSVEGQPFDYQSGNVNEIYTRASTALKMAGVNAKGEQKDRVSPLDRKVQAEMVKRGVELRQKGEEPDWNKLADAIRSELTAKEAEDMLKKAEDAGKKYGERLLEQYGKDYAQAFFRAMATVIPKLPVGDRVTA